ncbi:MAG: FHIPEP family type III secretion protein [bacterium]
MIDEETREVLFFSPEELKSSFVPWSQGECGQQLYLKLTREEGKEAFLYAGMGGVLQADVQKVLLRLTNEGWKLEGEVDIRFDGKSDPGSDPLFSRDLLCLEIGAQLLPLVDPARGAPLLARLDEVRQEIAQETGFITPGIQVRDNLKLLPNQYVVNLKESPLAQGELFLDRLMALGSLEMLGEIKGWITVEPAFHGSAKWIEISERDQAEQMGLFLLGPLNVLLTHLKEVVMNHAPEILGLQELHFILQRLALTHPVVVEDFIKDTFRLRKLRRILQGLLFERVSIRDMVTILETVGDHLEELEKTDMLTELVRLALGRQICFSHLSEEGKLRVFLIEEELESRMINSIQHARGGEDFFLGEEDVSEILRSLRKHLEEQRPPLALLVQPQVRPHLKRVLKGIYPGLPVLSIAEVPQGFALDVLGTLALEKKESPPPERKMKGKTVQKVH